MHRAFFPTAPGRYDQKQPQLLGDDVSLGTMACQWTIKKQKIDPWLLLVAALASFLLPSTAVAQTTDWQAVIRAARPAVVWILVETVKGVSAGSGTIVSADGYVLTAAHVIEGASRITVTVRDSETYEAKLVNTDLTADLAVLKIAATDLPYLVLGNSDEVEIEDPIRVLGYPLPQAGVGLIVVAGIIQGTRVQQGVRFFQHNAVTAPGHSGGPVINSRGQLIGVHQAALVDQPEYRLAVAANDARRLVTAAQTGTALKPGPPAQCPTCPPGMVLIPAGVSRAGIPPETVMVSAFYMDQYEVTGALWREVASWAMNHGYDISPSDGVAKGPDHPVVYIDWYEAVKWCNARSEMEGLTPCYYTDATLTKPYRTGRLDLRNEWVKWTANGYRLPTEAEWERAARGGCEGRRFPWCDTDTVDRSRANYYSYWTFRGDKPSCSSDTSPTEGFHPTYATGEKPYTSPVGAFPPNGYGLFDMAGNAAEWCWDSYWGLGHSSGTVDPRGPSFSSERVVRGGGWYSSAADLEVTARHGEAPGFSMMMITPGFELGFRTVRQRL